ncbi:low specificity L-threonine aldolase [Xinfangfangia sp. D13-10-4-6]|uniref:threonine aldolase family protein n=1 Tax=Pseudogemmobacter hezensis TaxID=2737662 RepID=UPI001552FC54|nr:beta-eliminating lyase-related protein [Pseudogemmobacter hezensis]NPD14490.1 low specificity L-threonine aldolase [Pseudogemmobacter hezensis]
MNFASDNCSGVAPQIMAALIAANEGTSPGYGNDALTKRLTAQIRAVFDAPEAEIALVATGTAANALSLATLCPPWVAIYCHQNAHIAHDECGAPEFFTHGAKLITVAGENGRMSPAAMNAAIAGSGNGGVHGVQRGALSLTNVTEAGTVLDASATAALARVARDYGLPVHLDGARFANAVAATGESPADLTWRAGVDILSLGGTKNGCMGVEAVVLFDPARAWEFQLRRKRGGHLLSKHRFLAAQMSAWLQDGLWLDLAHHANRMAARLADGLSQKPGVAQRYPVEANIMFPTWGPGTHARLQAKGASYYAEDCADREGARLVTSWATTEEEIDLFLEAL